jgi:hypothetical protein
VNSPVAGREAGEHVGVQALQRAKGFSGYSILLSAMSMPALLGEHGLRRVRRSRHSSPARGSAAATLREEMR